MACLDSCIIEVPNLSERSSLPFIVIGIKRYPSTEFYRANIATYVTGRFLAREIISKRHAFIMPVTIETCNDGRTSRLEQNRELKVRLGQVEFPNARLVDDHIGIILIIC